MVNAQEWLDEEYPKEAREGVKVLDIEKNELTGSLNLNDFLNLEELNCEENELAVLKFDKCAKLKKIKCSDNELTSLDVNNNQELQWLECSRNYNLTDLRINNNSQLIVLECYDCQLSNLEIKNNQKLLVLWCSYNQLTNVDFLTDLNKERLINLDIRNNSFSSQDLTVFSSMIGLEKLLLGNNPFFGSLIPLQNFEELRILDISDTKLDSDLEYLPASLQKIYCQSENSSSQITKLQTVLEPYKIKEHDEEYYDFQMWKRDLWRNVHPDLTSKLQKEWEKKEFSYREYKKWIKFGLVPSEVQLASYLRWKGLSGLSCRQKSLDIEGLRVEYLSNSEWQDWTDIHKEFNEFPFLQKSWEEYEFSFERVKEWIENGLFPTNFYLANYLEYSEFDPEEYVKFINKNVQEWLDHFYPKEVRNTIFSLEISQQGLEGSLNLNGFVNLEDLICPNNKIASLEIGNCPKLRWILCAWNELKELDCSNNPELTKLNCQGNEQLTRLDIRKNTKLTELYCYDCHLTDFDLKSCEQLEKLWCRENQFWEELGFTSEEYQKWKWASLSPSDHDFACFLRQKGYSYDYFLLNPNEVRRLRKEFDKWVKFAQNYLDTYYPLKKRTRVTKLSVSKKELMGELNFYGFASLEKLDCSDNKLTFLDVSYCGNLVELDCSDNELTDMVLPKERNSLTELNVSNNRLTDLTIFSHLVSLEELRLNNNPFFGSIEPLRKLEKLETLVIEETNLFDDWEYLPKIRIIDLLDNEDDLDDNKVKEQRKKLIPYVQREENTSIYYKLYEWKQDQLGYQWLKRNIQRINSQLNLQEIIDKFEFFNVKTGHILYHGNLKNIFFLFQSKNISLDKSIEELVIIIEIQRNKILTEFHNFNTEKELLRKVIRTYLEMKSSKKRYCDNFTEAHKQLETKFSEEQMNKIDKILDECDKLTSAGLKLKEKYGLSITFDGEGKISITNINITNSTITTQQGSTIIGSNFGDNTNLSYTKLIEAPKRARRDSWEERKTSKRTKDEKILEQMEIDNQELQSHIQISS